MVDIYRLRVGGNPAESWFAEWFLADPLPPYTVDFSTAKCEYAQLINSETPAPLQSDCTTKCFHGVIVKEGQHIWVLTGNAKVMGGYWYFEGKWPD